MTTPSQVDRPPVARLQVARLCEAVRSSHSLSHASRIRGGVRTVALVVLVGSLGLCMFLVSRIAASAGRHQLTYTEQAEQGMSTDESLGVALGAFRGLFVNVLWMRATELKEAGKFHEAIDLARTITRLQPRFPAVWQFHAWNLAYNISVATNTPQERWQWVNAGIKLLRDEGIPQNPNSLLLHKELSWIFQHKVQGFMDDANQFYKSQFAIEWTINIGPPPDATPEMRTTAGAKKVYADALRKVAQAPLLLQDLYEAQPKVMKLVDELSTQTKVDLTTPVGRRRFLFAVELLRSASKQSEALAQATKSAPLALPQDPIGKILLDPANLEARRALVLHIRKRVLVEDYHMEPDRMVRYTEKYGPMDWRHPASHAIYWAARGVEESLSRLNEKNQLNLDFINVDRQVIQSLQEQFRSGLVMFDINYPDRYIAIPNPHFMQAYGEVIEELMAREEVEFMAKFQTDTKQRVYNFYSAGYENFLHDTITFLFRRRQFEEAKKTQIKLITFRRLNRNDPGYKFDIAEDLDTFVAKNLEDRITSPNIAVQEVANGEIQSALVNGLLANDPDIYKADMDYAKLFHAAFMKEQYRLTGVDPTKARMEMMPKDFNLVAGYYSAFTLSLVGMTNAITIYNRLGDDVKLWAYDEFLRINLPGSMSEKDKQEAELQFAKSFPPPPGLAEHRLRMAEMRTPSGVERGKTELK